jgi:hypothetical protein
MTVTSLVAVNPPFRTVMRVVPAATPCTTPFDETVATDGVELIYVSTAPSTRVPVAFTPTAFSASDEPGAMNALAGLTCTDTTPGVAPPPPVGESLHAATSATPTTAV